MPQPKITTRFSNPVFDTNTNKLKLSVEFHSDTPNQRLFGMNVRFFYDASVFESGNASTVKFVDFEPGYGIFTGTPASYGTGTMGIAYFHLPTTACTYVNGAIQLNSPSSDPIFIQTDESQPWTRLFSIELTVRSAVSGTIYPSVIWDKETIPNNGGFLPGSDGVTITTVVNPSGIVTTQSTDEYAQNFNWFATPGALKAPWGNPQAFVPVSIS